MRLMTRPKLDMVVEVEDLKSSEGTEMPSKCTVSDMRKTFRSKTRIYDRLGLEYDLFLVDSKSTDDPDWEEWRNSLKMTIGGHTFGGLLGFGGDNQSAHKHFCRFLGSEEKQEANWFGKQAMQHGKEKEEVVKYHVETLGLVVDCYPGESLLYELSLKADGHPINICITPDLMNADNVYEIKCPYYNADKFEHPLDYKNDVEARNVKKYGCKLNPSWWLQAAFYAMITGKGYFTVIVCYYTTKTDQYMITYYDFGLDMASKLWLQTELGHILRNVAQPPKKKYKPSIHKERVLRLIGESLFFSTDSEVFLKHIDGTISPVPPRTSILHDDPPCLHALYCYEPQINEL